MGLLVGFYRLIAGRLWAGYELVTGRFWADYGAFNLH